MDKWATLRQVLEDDYKIFNEQAGGVWTADNEPVKLFAEHAAEVIEVYLNFMTEIDEEELRLYEGIVGRTKPTEEP